MAGHTTPTESEKIRVLEVQLSEGRISIDGLITLGLLYLEPAHEEGKAVDCFESVLARDPGNAMARLWLAYVLEHSEMDAGSLQRALDLLRPLCQEGACERGGALFLFALISRALGTSSDIESIGLLESSIEAEPNWVSNRYSLSKLYGNLGLAAEALEQIEVALRNFIAEDPSWSLLHKNYEAFITWRTSRVARDMLQEEKQELQGG